MSMKTHQIKVPMILNWILVLICVVSPIKIVESRKLDETTVPTPNGNEKCEPCGGYTPSSPPPIVYLSPPPPSPPPPLIYYSPPPPPPSPKKPPSSYCPPPPSSPYIYMTGPPGNLYPVDENFSGASSNRHQCFAEFFPLLVSFLGMLAFW